MESQVITKPEDIAHPQPIKKKTRQLIIRHQRAPEHPQTETVKQIENMLEEQPSFSQRPMQPNVALHSLKFAKKIQQQVKQKSISEASKLFSQHTESLHVEKNEMENDLYNQEIEGPQLKIDKQNVSFKGPTGLVQTELIQVINNGSAAVHYEWAKLKNEQSFKAGILDSDERFFCHHKKNVIKPGERLPFSFSFKSNVTGIFYEEWTLKCEPPLIDPLAIIKFTGQAVEPDPSIQWRDDLKVNLNEVYINENIGEIINDIIQEVRTPTPPLPDLENPEIAKQEFEEKNKHLRLYYCPLIIKLYKQLIRDLFQSLNIVEEYWDLDIRFIETLINKIKDNEEKQFFLARFDEFNQLATYLPLERRPVYKHTKEVIEQLVNELPNISNNMRRDMELWDYAFQEPQDLTEEELGKKKVEEEKMKAEWLKKSKKKKWGEEEEKQALQQYHEKLTQKCNEYFIELFDNFDTNAEYSKALTLMQDNERANYKYFKKLFRTKPLIDVDLDGRRVMLRVHFRLIKNSNAQEIKLQHEENIINQEEEERKQEEARQEALKQEQQKQKQRKGGKKQQQVVAVEEKKQERTFDMSFLDQQNLQDIIKTIKFCVEHLAKLVILVPSYDCANGVYRERSSMRFFVDYLQSLLPETIINYNEQGYIIEEFADKMENDFYPENSLLVLENVFFQKEETGRMIDEDRNIETLSYTEKLPFIRTLIEYSPLYVIEDKFNFLNSAVSSIRYVKPESVVLGLGMAEEIKALAYWFQVMKGSTAPFVAVIGGDISLFKLLAIDSLINFCQVIWVTGKIALYLILAKKEENQLFDVVIDGTNIKLKDVVSQIFKKAKEKNVEIKLPEDVQVCEKQENQDIYSIDAQEYINENTKIFRTFGPPQDLIHKYQQEQELIRQQEEQEQLLKEQQQKDQKKGGKESKDQKKDNKEKDKQQQEKAQQPEKKRIEIPGWNEIPEDSSIFNILEWGPTTLDSLSQTFSQQFKLLWIDSISPNPRTFPPVFNQSNKLIGSLLMGFQQRQRKLIQQEGLNHLFSQDSFVTLIGTEVCDLLNGFELVTEEEEQRRKEIEEKKKRQQEAQEDPDEEQQLDEEDRRSSGSQGTQGVQIEKRNNPALIADFVGYDSEFACQLLTGQYLPDIYDKTEESLVDEDFDFLLEG